MELESVNHVDKKRNRYDEMDDTKEDPVLSEPKPKRPKLIDLINTGSEQDLEEESQSSNGAYVSDESESSDDDDEEDDGPPKHPASWWRDFYQVPAEFHTAVIMARDQDDFLKLVLPPVKPKWNDKVMYAMSYEGCRSASTWTHYSCVTKEEDVIIKAFVAANPDYEISLGSLEGKHSEVLVTWNDLVDWESSDPRDLQEHNPDVRDYYTEQILTSAKLEARHK